MKYKMFFPITFFFTTILATSNAMAEHSQRHAEHRSDRHSERMLSHLDADGDNLISIDEFKVPEERMFRHADSDGDGIVTLDEIQRQFSSPPFLSNNLIPCLVVSGMTIRTV